MKPRGEIEAAMCQGYGQLRADHLGARTRDSCPLVGDLLVIRLRGVLTAGRANNWSVPPLDKAGICSASTNHLIETARPVMEKLVQDVMALRP